jgi:hypothetical protein
MARSAAVFRKDRVLGTNDQADNRSLDSLGIDSEVWEGREITRVPY